ncbi:MAG TPA: NIPSNAP family protein [Cyclobacteriaceae bacterium]|nr:NIPSNAP family protein [Cyclobacteriaceae bacterium]
MKNSIVCMLLLSLILGHAEAAPSREYFEFRTYRFKSLAQEERMEAYLQKALMPALHRLGMKKIGVFKPIDTDSTYGKKIFLFMAFSSLAEIEQLSGKLETDKQYLADGEDYINAPYDNPPYARFETTILKAFTGMPESAVPMLKSMVKERVYELRSYEGYTEKIYQNKVQMFNAGDEVGLFKRLGFNAVFYAEVIAGSTMPNLMYMTTFENQASRDQHWKAFGEDPQWKKLVAMPEYQHNVSKHVIYFLRPTSYSDI